MTGVRVAEEELSGRSASSQTRSRRRALPWYASRRVPTVLPNCAEGQATLGIVGSFRKLANAQQVIMFHTGPVEVDEDAPNAWIISLVVCGITRCSSPLLDAALILGIIMSQCKNIVSPLL